MKKYSHVMVAALLFFVIGCGKDEKKETQTNETMPALADVTSITITADKRSLVGRKVEMASAPAQQVVGNYIFWVGDVHSAIPVVRGDKLRGPVTEHVRAGQRVRIKGTVRLLESVSPADIMWDRITDTEKRDIMGAQIFIQADEVSIIHSSDVRDFMDSNNLSEEEC